MSNSKCKTCGSDCLDNYCSEECLHKDQAVFRARLTRHELYRAMRHIKKMHKMDANDYLVIWNIERCFNVAFANLVELLEDFDEDAHYKIHRPFPED